MNEIDRIKDYDATGIAPNGRLYAGDLNELQDLVAALEDFTQTIKLGGVAIGEESLQLIRYGLLEARLTGALRTDGILRGLGGIIGGTFTTTQRDAIASGKAPYGLMILNSTTNRIEWNSGTDGTRIWKPLGGISSGPLSERPTASSSNADSLYFADDDEGGTIYFSDGDDWQKAAWSTNDSRIHQVNLFGLWSEMPTPSAAYLGFTYFCTDTLGTFFCDGLNWILQSQPAKEVTPVEWHNIPEYDGMRVKIVNDHANPAYAWYMVCKPGLPTSEKWMAEPGEPLVSRSDSVVSSATTTAPTITPPFTAKYIVEISANILFSSNPSSSATSHMTWAGCELKTMGIYTFTGSDNHAVYDSISLVGGQVYSTVYSKTDGQPQWSRRRVAIRPTLASRP